MNIRIANVADIEKILPLEEQIFGFHSKTRPDWIDNNKRPFNYEFMKDLIENNNAEIFIAEDDNKIIGHCIVSIREIKNHRMFHNMTNVEIEDLFVDEHYRKKGIGKKLFEEARVFAKEKGAKFIEFGVWEFNQNAIKFYEYIGMNKRLYRMELEL